MSKTFFRSRAILLFWPLIPLFLAPGCGNPDGGTGSSGRISPTYNGPTEVSYCSSSISYSGGKTVSGSATYQKREIFGLGGSGGLGDAGSKLPIRRAEVRVLDSNGAVAQCATTDNSGNFSFSVPSGTYTVYVNARASNSYVKVSVLDRPEYNNVYGISQSVTVDAANVTMSAMNAGVTGDILGAPFNIFDKILKANEFLKTQVGTCGTDITGCSDFSVAPKVTVYWEKGFNPNAYYDAPTSGVSFYIKSYKRLFILGGIEGDTDQSDTDHFDDSIILHEYGHHLESAMFTNDSPGGSHSGNKQIDPRLAWSEGWSNFFQAAALDHGYYIDTIGNSSGSTSFIFQIPLESTTGYCTAGSSTSGCDIPTRAGEGNFREFSITRILWDMHDDDADDDDNDGFDSKFNEIWAAAIRSDGFNDTDVAFRSIGHLHDILHNGIAITDYTALRTSTDHKHYNDAVTNRYRGQYALYVETGGSCLLRNFSMTPIDDPNDDGSFANMNWHENNDFLHYKHSGGGITFKLNYKDADSTGTVADLDLYIYDESAVIGNEGNIIGVSDNEPLPKPIPDASAVHPEEVIISNLPAGNYLINIKVYTFNRPAGGALNYEVLIGSNRLCPADLP